GAVAVRDARRRRDRTAHRAAVRARRSARRASGADRHRGRVARDQQRRRTGSSLAASVPAAALTPDEENATMIEVQAVIPWSAAERPAYEELAIREIHVATRDPRRAVRFYERVFGFRLLGPADANPVVLQATARTDIVLHDVRDPGVEHRGFLDAFGFV